MKTFISLQNHTLNFHEIKNVKLPLGINLETLTLVGSLLFLFFLTFCCPFPLALTTHIFFPTAVAGFAGGFLVPEPQMPLMYYWLFYINPTHWAYSGMVNILLKDTVFDCKYASPLECESSMGTKQLLNFSVILTQFYFVSDHV